MKHNMGKAERILRMVIGVPLTLFSLILTNGFGVFYGVINSVTVVGLALAVIGITLFVTGLTGTCLLYSVLNFNTCRLCREGSDTHA